MSQPSNLFLSIGKPVKDEYGRLLGRIVTFATSPSGKFESAFIERGDGRFTKHPMESLIFNGSDVTYISKIKSKARVFCDQIPFIWRKDQALKELMEKRKISSELYQELHNNFNAVLNQLSKDTQHLIDEAVQEISRCEEELKALSYGILHLELEHEIGKISEDSYRSAFSLLQENLKRTSAEKSDLESIKSKLSNILIGDSPKINDYDDKDVGDSSADDPMVGDSSSDASDKDSSSDDYTSDDSSSDNKVSSENSASETKELPEPPVVVYVKEVGKAGI